MDKNTQKVEMKYYYEDSTNKILYVSSVILDEIGLTYLGKTKNTNIKMAGSMFLGRDKTGYKITELHEGYIYE